MLDPDRIENIPDYLWARSDEEEADLLERYGYCYRMTSVVRETPVVRVEKS